MGDVAELTNQLLWASDKPFLLSLIGAVALDLLIRTLDIILCDINRHTDSLHTIHKPVYSEKLTQICTEGNLHDLMDQKAVRISSEMLE
jgi:hypothetical protein